MTNQISPNIMKLSILNELNVENSLELAFKFKPYLTSKHFLKFFCKDYNHYKEINIINSERFWWRK